MPFTPDAKSPGDLIKSADWNEAMTEIVRLETDKVNKAGDEMTGDLSVRSFLSIGGLPATALNTSVQFQTDGAANLGAAIGTMGTSGTGNPGDLVFATGGASAGDEKMRLTTTGRLGIGTNNPQTRLHFTGHVTTNWDVAFNHFNQAFGANQSRPWLTKAWNGTLGDFLTLNSSGNRSNAVQSSMILAENVISFGRGHNNGDQLSTEWLRINTSGNVGMGTASPQQRLDVGGNIQMSGSLYCKLGSEETTNTRLYKGYYGLIAADGRTRFNVVLDHNPNLTTNPYSFGVGHTYNTNNGQLFFWGTDYKFRVDSDGRAYADTSFSGGGADYADLFESHNEKEIAPGTAVVLTDDGKVRKAKKNEIPIGVITKNPSILGNNPMDWHNKYLKDEFGNKIMEKFEDEIPVSQEAEEQLLKMPKSKLKTKAGRKGLTKVVKRIRAKLNPEYDPEKKYIPRVKRPEWQAVGLIGQLPLIKGQPVAPTWIKIKDVSDKVELWLVK